MGDPLLILLPYKNLAIYTPNRCGSTSLHQSMCDSHVGGLYVVGPDPFGKVSKHTDQKFDEMASAEVAIVVRNPYARAASLYGYHCMYCDSHGKEPGSLDEFLSTLTLSKDAWFRPISEAFTNVKYSMFWQLEHIYGCFRKQNLCVNLRRENASQLHPPMNDDQKRLIRDWAEPDCEAFQYPLVK